MALSLATVLPADAVDGSVIAFAVPPADAGLPAIAVVTADAVLPADAVLTTDAVGAVR